MTGPYYPRPDQLTLRPGAFQDNDLTLVPGVATEARGERLLVTGQVLSKAGRPVPGATVEIWQANSAGRYLSSKDTRAAREHDAGFQYFGICTTDSEGRYLFRTIVPPAYPSGVIPGWIRPPHIHVQVRGTGLPDFTTQVYWDDPTDPLRTLHTRLRRRDLLIKGVKPRKREWLIRPVLRTRAAQRHLDFPIVLDQDRYLP